MKNLFYLVIFLVSVSIFLVHYVISGQAVYGDGIGYYAHVRSWVIDHDLDTTNEYKHVYSPQNNNTDRPESAKRVQIVREKPDGKAENFYGPGVAILLLPFYLLADLIVIIASGLGLNLYRNGYSDIYQIISGIGAIIYVVIALVFLEKLIFGFIKNQAMSKLTVVTIFFATQLLYYGSFDVLNSHFASFFLSVMFFYLLLRPNESLKKTFLLGILAGLATTTRLQDGVMVLVWIAYILSLNKPFSEGIKLVGKNIWMFALGFILSVFPLIIHWSYVFGGVFEHTYIRLLMRDADRPIDLFGSLFHPMNGLFTQTPILLVSIVYFLYFVRKKKAQKYWLLFLFFFIQFVIVTLQGGWTAASFGARMYISSLVFFSILLAELLVFLKKKYSYALVLGFCIVFMVFNLFQAGRFILWDKQASDNRQGVEVSTQKRIEAMIEKLSTFSILDQP